MYNIFSHLSPILLFLYLFFRRWLFQLLSKEIDLSKKHACLLTSVTIIKNTYCSLHYRILGTARHISNNDSSSAIQLFIHDLVIKIRPTGMLILKWGSYQLPNTPLHTAMSFKHWYQGSAILLAYWYNVSWQLILFLEVFLFPTSDLLAWFGNTCPFLKIRCRKKNSHWGIFLHQITHFLCIILFLCSLFMDIL